MKNIFKGKSMELFRKVGIAVIFGAVLLQLSIVGLIHLSEMPVTKVQSVETNTLISMDSRQMAYQSLIIAPFKTRDVFISDEYDADFDFTSVGLAWEEVAPEGTQVEAELRFKVNGKWSDWLDLEEEEDPLAEGYKYGIASSNPAAKTQYKFLMYGDGNASPLIKNSKLTFIKSGATVSSAPKVAPKFSSNPALSNATLLALNATSGSGVVSRDSWGANESYRYLPDGQEPDLIPRDPVFYEKYKDELQYSRVVDLDQSGKRYVWPLQYPEEVNKFVIHHTATTKDLDNPKQALRDIYYYHAVTRGWGDIGYNYVVDQSGKIYEGRYGGEGIIGAHSGPGNHGSIGIAVLGNFQDSPVPEKVVVAISQFINKKAKIHNIDVDGYSQFRGELMANIFGHRDIMSTTCPGQYLYDKIPVLRILAARIFDLKTKFVKDYDYQDQSELYYLELKPLEQMQVQIKMENIGKVNWGSETFIVVNQDDKFKNVVSFPEKDGVMLAKMNEPEVMPGETATFNVTLKGGTKGDTVYLNIAPLVNGVKKIDDYIVLPVTIQQPIYKYEIKDTKLPDEFIQKGEEYDGWVKLENTGNVTWENITLGDTTAASVEPGETKQFNFTFTAPQKAGQYSQALVPKIEGVSFASSPEISFSTTVYRGDYDAEMLSHTLVTNWEQGNDYTLNINLRNIGKETWSSSQLKAAFFKDDGINIQELSLSPKTVARGETATVKFTVKVDPNAKIDSNNPLIANLRIGSSRLGQPVHFRYQVKAKGFQTTVSEDVPQIRVKLGFEGEPEVTANGTFDLYSKGNFLSTINAGDTAKITFRDGKYQVTTGSLAFVKDEEIRFVPHENAILQIKNFEHRPAWNQDLNDNQYRGTLEVRNVDGKLVVINELALEDYLKGLGEVSNSEEPEKIKAIIVAARSYAKFYTDIDEKFPGKPYNLDDNPDVSQKYLGYGLEKRSPKVSQAVRDTKGKVIAYNGKVVKAPYFNQSDGTRTKSAQEVWGWTNTPYLLSVDDSLCGGDQFLGHGVGLSGCGAHSMAVNGSTYQEILKHYYTNIEILDLY